LGRAATHGFSPPEQVMGTSTDERADIYALGATFYALLTGRNPPAAHERVAGKELTPPSEIVPDVPPELEEAILQALSLNMHHRQQTVREFAMGLEGMEFENYSRPVRTDAQAPATVAISPSSRLPTGKPTGLKIPTGRATAGTGRQPVSSRVAGPSAQRNIILPVAGGILGLVAVAALAWYFIFNKPETKPETAAVQPPAPVLQTPPAAVPLVQPQVPQAPAQTVTTPTPAATPYPTTTPTAPVQPPVANIQPPPSTPPATGGGSAADILRNRVPDQETPAVSTPSAPVSAPAVARPRPAPRPVVAERPRPVAPPVERPRPAKPSGGGEPSWTIIPGGAHKTD